MASALRRSPPLLAALITLIVAGAALSATHHSPRLAVPRAAALAAAQRSLLSIPTLRGLRFDRTAVSPVDSKLVRVSFWNGDRIAAEVAVRPDGSIAQGTAFSRLAVPYGDWVAYEPALLIALAALFALACGVAPLRHQRNLDVAAALSLVAPVVLLQHRYLTASVLAAVPGLGYLLVRMAHVGLSTSNSPPARSVPLFDVLTARWSGAQRVRMLRLVLAALALTFVMVGVSSPDPVDVIYGVMEGATRLLHGILPYGHMPGDVVHGDTYPILSYALYTPLAWLAPVGSTWDSVDVGLAAAVAAAVASAAALAAAFGARVRRPRVADETVGLRAALAWLAFPPLLITASTGTTDVVLAAMLLSAVLLWRRPGASTAMLATAGWFKLAPFALLAVRLAPLRGRRLLAPLAALAAVSGGALALVLALGGSGGINAMVHAIAFQFSRGSPQSLWAALGVPGLEPIGEAAVLALIVGASAQLRRHPQLAADRARVAATCGAILIALQLAAAYWAFLYLVWVVPLLTLSLLTPQRERAVRPLPPEPVRPPDLVKA